MKTRYRIATLFAVLALLVVAATIMVLPRADAAHVTVFHVTPTNLTFNTVQGVNPPVQKITLSNSGKHTIYWRTISAISMSFVGIAPSGGKIAPGKSMTVMAVVNARRLVPGPYTASFSLNSFDSNNKPTPGHSSVVVEVEVVVTAPQATPDTSEQWTEFEPTKGVVLKADAPELCPVNQLVNLFNSTRKNKNKIFYSCAEEEASHVGSQLPVAEGI